MSSVKFDLNARDIAQSVFRDIRDQGGSDQAREYAQVLATFSAELFLEALVLVKDPALLKAAYLEWKNSLDSFFGKN